MKYLILALLLVGCSSSKKIENWQQKCYPTSGYTQNCIKYTDQNAADEEMIRILKEMHADFDSLEECPQKVYADNGRYDHIRRRDGSIVYMAHYSSYRCLRRTKK